MISAYAVTFGGFLLLAGRLADLRGSRTILIAGLSLFGACSLLCGLAWDGPSLVAGRALQGLGAAMISPAALGALIRTFPEGRERTRVLGIWGGVGAVAASAGALLGGVLVQYASWRWVFLVNVPAVIAAVAVAWPLLARSGGSGHRRLDPVSATLLTGGLAGLVAAFSEAGVRGWTSPSSSVGFALALGLVAAYGRREARSADPLLPLAAFRATALVAAVAAGVVLGAVMLASFLLLTVGMHSVLGLSAIATGAGIFAARGSGVLWTPVATRLADRFGAPALLATGMAVMAAAFALLAQLPDDPTFTRDLLPATAAARVRDPGAVPRGVEDRARDGATGVQRRRVGHAQHVAVARRCRRRRHRRVVRGCRGRGHRARGGRRRAGRLLVLLSAGRRAAC